MPIVQIGHRIRLKTRLDAINTLLCSITLKPDNLLISDTHLMNVLNEAQFLLNETIKYFKLDKETLEKIANESISQNIQD